MFKRIILMAFLFAPLMCSTSFAGDMSWTKVADEIEAVLHTATEAYAQGRAAEAKAAVSGAYFDLFEGSGMETAVSVHISDKRKAELEGMFGAVRSAMAAGKPRDYVDSGIKKLSSALHEDAARLSAKGGAKQSPWSLFFNSFLIILREGFEAILVIGALTAYLAKTGHKDKVRAVYRGALLALGASLVTAVLFQTVITISGAAAEAVEGATMLVATAVLFYVSYWLISKAESARWQNYIKSKVESSIARSNVFALAFAAFLAVYREGAETVLFYQALYSSAGGDSSSILAGFVLGSVVLAVVFLAIKYGSLRVPLGPFFAVTSALLYYLAFSFAGRGVVELQEAGLVGATIVEKFPAIPFFGIYPNLEGLVLQSVLLVAALAALTYSLTKPGRRAASGG